MVKHSTKRVENYFDIEMEKFLVSKISIFKADTKVMDS